MKKHKSIKSLSLFYHGTVKYIDQIIINLNTHCLLIDCSKLFLLIIRNYILSKLSIWMLSFRYRNNEKIIQYLLTNRKKRWKEIERQKNPYWHIHTSLDDGKANEQIKMWTWNKIINEIGLYLKKKLDFLLLPFFQRFYTIMIFSFPFVTMMLYRNLAPCGWHSVLHTEIAPQRTKEMENTRTHTQKRGRVCLTKAEAMTL